MTYTILDTHTGRVVRVLASALLSAHSVLYAATRKRQAYALADRMDQVYGAVRYVVRPEPVKQPEPGSVLAVGPL